MDRVKDFFKQQSIYSEDFFSYIKDKTLILPFDTPLSWFGCFPILEDGILKDMRLSVPEIVSEQNFLVNIHEYYHAYELYNELGYLYSDNVDEREQAATNFEYLYLTRRNDSNH